MSWKRKMKKIKGVSLLEVLLVTVIVAAACIVSIRFYSHTKQKTTVLQASLQVKRVVEASHQWLDIYRQADFSSWEDNAMNSLVAAGLLEESDKTNPWGGVVSVSADSGGSLKITSAGITDDGCGQLVARFRSMATSSCEESTWTATF